MLLARLRHIASSSPAQSVVLTLANLNRWPNLTQRLNQVHPDVDL